MRGSSKGPFHGAPFFLMFPAHTSTILFESKVFDFTFMAGVDGEASSSSACWSRSIEKPACTASRISTDIKVLSSSSNSISDSSSSSSVSQKHNHVPGSTPCLESSHQWQVLVATVITMALAIHSRSKIFTASSSTGLSPSCASDEVGASVNRRTLRVFGVMAGQLPSRRLATDPFDVVMQSPYRSLTAHSHLRCVILMKMPPSSCFESEFLRVSKPIAIPKDASHCS
jgi:hypothetical protein